MTNLLTVRLIPKAVMNPRGLSGKLNSPLRRPHKAVLRTTFNQNHLLSFLTPTNTGERKPEAISRIASNVDKDQMFFVSHTRAIPRPDCFRDFRFRRLHRGGAEDAEEKRQKLFYSLRILCLCGEQFSFCLAVLPR